VAFGTNEELQKLKHYRQNKTMHYEKEKNQFSTN
jgi:hypothetical protein